MPLKQFSPTSPGRRFHIALQTPELSKKAPESRLLAPLRRSGGRNNTGRITQEHRGGGAAKHYRLVDFRRNKLGIPGVVTAIEYDPNRNAHLALITYRDGEKRYIIHPIGLTVGQTVLAAADAEIFPGNALPLKNIPVGTSVHNVALKIGGRGQLCRAAGTFAQVMAKDGHHIHLKMPSGEVRLIHHECWATVGQVGNEQYENIAFGKAGRVRWLGWRPHVRGMAMNPVDHPHGGGEGRSKGGNHPRSATNVPAKGYKTRGKKPSDRLIVKRRK
ncbi:MAG: 50S ribosomal protein L2 [Deltaproteobacteria bacterium]|nr:50S ribosomal protein L2 [Deltaproteobacteria bacterium]